MQTKTDSINMTLFSFAFYLCTQLTQLVFPMKKIKQSTEQTPPSAVIKIPINILASKTNFKTHKNNE